MSSLLSFSHILLSHCCDVLPFFHSLPLLTTCSCFYPPISSSLRSPPHPSHLFAPLSFPTPSSFSPFFSHTPSFSRLLKGELQEHLLRAQEEAVQQERVAQLHQKEVCGVKREGRGGEASVCIVQDNEVVYIRGNLEDSFV